MQAGTSLHRWRLGFQPETAALEHALRGIESDDLDTSARRGDEHSSRPAAEFEHWPSTLPCYIDVETHVWACRIRDHVIVELRDEG
jgi:hypothetical protein